MYLFPISELRISSVIHSEGGTKSCRVVDLEHGNLCVCTALSNIFDGSDNTYLPPFATFHSQNYIADLAKTLLVTVETTMLSPYPAWKRSH